MSLAAADNTPPNGPRHSCDGNPPAAGRPYWEAYELPDTEWDGAPPVDPRRAPEPPALHPEDDAGQYLLDWPAPQLMEEVPEDYDEIGDIPDDYWAQD